MRACISKRAIVAVAVAVWFAGCATTDAPKEILGVACEAPPPLHCPDANCPGQLIGNLGNATDPKTGRKFFLDYPCNLKRSDKLTFVLNLHGGGSIGNWQRHYFPIMDLKEKYKLIVATPSGTGPNGGTGSWSSEKDDQHLRNIVDMVYEQFDEKNIKAFWLAGTLPGRADFEPTHQRRLLSRSPHGMGESVRRAIGLQARRCARADSLRAGCSASCAESRAYGWRGCTPDSLPMHPCSRATPSRTSIARVSTS